MEVEKEGFLETIFNFIAPGKPLRQSLDRIQEASLGALIILSDYEDIKDLVDGGFSLNTPFTSQKIYELAKMDGAILINENIDTILGANLQMQPDPKIETEESGTRHRTAQRIAKQKNVIVITISERRHKITIYKGKDKYILKSIDDLLIRSSQALRSLEKYAEILDKYLSTLDLYEFEETVTIEEVLNGIRQFSLLFDMKQIVLQNILELGKESNLIKLQYDEIIRDKEDECLEFIKDYFNPKKDKSKLDKHLLAIKNLKEDRYDNEKLLAILGYDKNQMLEKTVNPRGYRFLHNVNKITKKDIDLLVDTFKELPKLLSVSYEELLDNKILSKKVVDRLIRYIYRYRQELQIHKNF